MKLGKVQLHSPAGAMVEIEATGEGEIVIEVAPEQGIILIRDTGLPLHEQGHSRLVAQVPISWAVFPTWEFTGLPEHNGVPVGTSRQ